MFILKGLTEDEMRGLLINMDAYDNEICYYENIGVNSYKYYTSRTDVLRWYLTRKKKVVILNENELQPLANRPPYNE